MADNKNPWLITDIEEFHFYCCPECEFKDHAKVIFVHHVLQEHPNAKQFLEINQFIDNDDDDIHVGTYVKEEEEDGNYGDFVRVGNYIDTTNQSVIKQEETMVDITKYEFQEDEEVNGFDESFNDEIKEPSATKREKCQICQKWSKNLAYHTCKPNSGKEGHYKCPLCEKTFRHQSKLLHHQTKTYHEKRQCNLCDEFYITKEQLVAHRKQYHPETIEGDKKCYICTICQKEVTSLDGLKLHKKRVHDGERQCCELCGKWYSNLINHKRFQHTEIEMKHECKECKATYTHQSTLNDHIKRVHEGIPDEKKYSCEQCGSMYRNPSQLKMHIKTVHDKVYDFKCEHCNRSFGRKGSLIYHVKSIHEVQNKLACKYCGKSYDKNYLRDHIKEVHETQRNYSCHICSNSFKRHNHLKTHLKTIHKEF